MRRNKKRRRYVFISAHFSSITWEYEFSSRFIYGLMRWLENADSLEYTANNRCDLFSRVADAYRGTSEGCHCQCRNGRFHDALHVTTIFHSFFFSPTRWQCRRVDHDFVHLIRHRDTNPLFLFEWRQQSLRYGTRWYRSIYWHIIRYSIIQDGSCKSRIIIVRRLYGFIR